jgi:hypothetical protein
LSWLSKPFSHPIQKSTPQAKVGSALDLVNIVTGKRSSPQVDDLSATCFRTLRA